MVVRVSRSVTAPGTCVATPTGVFGTGGRRGDVVRGVGAVGVVHGHGRRPRKAPRHVMGGVPPILAAPQPLYCGPERKKHLVQVCQKNNLQYGIICTMTLHALA